MLPVIYLKMADDMVTLDWSNEEELLKEEAEEEKKAEAAKKDEVVKTEKDTGDDKEKKDGDTEAMDTCTTEVKEEEKKEEEWEKTLLTTVLRGPIKITNVQIRDLLSRELQHVLHKSVNTQIDFSNKKGIIHLNFLPLKDRVAVDILKKLAKFQFSNKDVKIQCSRAVAALLGFELRRQGIGPAPQGTLQFDKVLFLYGIPSETTEEVLRAMFECPICIIPLDEEGKNMGAAFLEFRSKKASKQCYNDNQDVEIGDVKVTLHNKYQFAGRKEEEDEEKEERDKKKKEQEKKAKEGQQRRNPNQNRGRGAGKSFNRSHAVKQKFNQARQMGAFSAGGGMGRMGFGDGMGMGGGRRMGGAGVSPNLMMNQMMAMMRMSQGMGDGGMGDGMGMGGMGEGMGMGGRRMGGGGMGQGMGSGMGRMGRQGGMGGGGMGGFDDFSGGDYGFDDYESGYNQGRNSAGRRQPQSLMGGQRRGSFGSAPNEQKDSVVDLFESALDAVDNQIGGRGNPNRQRSLSGGRNSEPFGGNLQSGVQNRQKLQGKRNNAKTGKDFSWERQGGSQSVGGASNTMGTRFGSPGKNKQPMSLLEFSDFNVSGGNKTGYGESSSSRFGQDSNDRFLGGENDRFKQKEEYSDYSYFQDDSYDKSRSYNEGFNVSNVGQDRNTSFSASRSIELYGSGNEDIYRHNADSGQSNRQNRLSVDSIQPVSYPEIYSSKGSSGMAEIYGSSALASKPTKRTFTEQPLKRTYDDYLVSSTERAQDDFVFKKPMLTSFKGVQQQGIIASKQQGNRGGQQQGNRGGHQQGNRGQQQGNRGGHQQGNKGGQQQGNRGGQQKGNRGGQQGNRGQKRGQGRRNKKSGRQNNSGFSY